MRLKIEVTENGKEIFSGEFDRFPINFGRASHCELCLPSVSYLSRVHGVITFDDGAFYVTDLNSKAGLASVSGKKFLKAKFGQTGVFAISGRLVIRLEEVGENSLGATSVDFDATKVGEQVPYAIEKSHAKARSDFGVREGSFVEGFIKQPSVSRSFAPQVPDAPSASLSSRTFEEHLPDDPKTQLTSLGELFKLEVRPNFNLLPSDQVTLQAVLAWGDDILDVRQFRNGDVIWIGGDVESPVYLPGTVAPIVIGRAGVKQGKLQLPHGLKWRLNRSGLDFESSRVKSEDSSATKQLVDVQPGDIFSCELGNQVSLHLRYVETSKFFIRRTWLENREEFIKAFKISGALHVVAFAFFLLSASKVETPKVNDVPQRFARLLVEPPKTPLAPPPKPEPTPEPPKIAEQPKPPEPKLQPKKPQPKVVKKPAPVPDRKVVRKATKRPSPQEQPQRAAPPQPSAEDVAAASLMDALAAGPSAGPVAKDIKIDNNQRLPTNSQAVSTTNISSVVTSKSGKLSSAAGMVGGMSNSKVGQLGYAKGPKGKAGSRGIAGQVVGTPNLEDFSGTTNGLSEKEIMAEVNRHLPKIQRCYERALLNDPDIAGRVQYEWDISPVGVVKQVRVKRSEITNGDTLNNCVTTIFRNMKFPAAKNRQPTTANLGFPFGKEN